MQIPDLDLYELSDARRRAIRDHVYERSNVRGWKEPLWRLMFRMIITMTGIFVFALSVMFAGYTASMHVVWWWTGHAPICVEFPKNSTVASRCLTHLENQIGHAEMKIDESILQLRRDLEKRMAEEWGEVDLMLADMARVLDRLAQKLDDGYRKVSIGVDFDGDYAQASRGGRVLRHSEPDDVFWRWVLWWIYPRMVSVEADKMISPSFGLPGHCFALKGTSGFVDISLSAPVVPLAVTLEHQTKGTSGDDWLNAPKQCRVYGWMQGKDPVGKFVLTVFTYYVEKGHTFLVVPSMHDVMIDTIRFEFSSNHGNPSHTCIYRLSLFEYASQCYCRLIQFVRRGDRDEPPHDLVGHVQRGFWPSATSMPSRAMCSVQPGLNQFLDHLSDIVFFFSPEYFQRTHPWQASLGNSKPPELANTRPSGANLLRRLLHKSGKFAGKENISLGISRNPSNDGRLGKQR
ncbi:SUN domain-containing protein [Striga asiatica]|uniref:SUN domain-containing protein n=1 Tax=Striga asiatica TaxID=4170 RepID=A0A5A7PNN6_STRAF|nr:SUN domain-containing protein [Striga asiatica]